jgi:O-acetyl-ADP-ribose deacetylase (regulator of RNase III)
MQFKVNQSIIEIVQGDITNETTDAIVNAANSRLAGGGGVDGAIHKAGGPKIMEECKKYNGCPTGKAVITSGGNLKTKYVIHTVGPIYSGKEKDAELLSSSYWESLKLAEANNITSISFPSISTGAYGYPIEKASKVALETIINSLKEHTIINLVRIVLYSEKDLLIYLSNINIYLHL